MEEKKPSVLTALIALAAVVYLIYTIASAGIHYFGPKVNKSWVTDVACTEVKSEVYKDFGEVPIVSGKILYQNDNHYIVAVNYQFQNEKWSGSVACHVIGYRESNCFVSGMTNDFDFDYDFSSRLDELKALWAIA